MHLPFEARIGLRYVRARSANRFLSFISLTSMLGIAIGVAVLIVVMSVVNGFERELRERILAMSAHASIAGLDGRLADWRGKIAAAAAAPRVSAAAPYVEGQALATHGERLSGIAVRGIDPAAERKVSGIAGLMREGELGALAPRGYGIVIGVELARALDVGLGDRPILMIADGIVTPAGVVPRMRRFEVVGIFRAGMHEFDRRFAYIHIDDAARLYRTGEDVSGIRLATADVFAAPAIVREAARAVGGGVLVSDWTRGHSGFFRSIEITKSILFVILLLVVAVAAFNIVSTLVMVVKDKQSDIAILRTVGASPASVMRVFVTQGALIGVLGTLGGLALGALLTLNLEAVVAALERAFDIKFLAPDVYFISDLPAELRLGDVAVISVVAFALALLSTLYPAWRGAQTEPAEALRYD